LLEKKSFRVEDRSMTKALMWFRNDLRLDDNPALNFAAENFAEVVPVYIFSPEEEAEWPLGAASRWWLHHSLEALSRSIQGQGGSLRVLRSGSSLEALERLCAETQARTIVWNRRYEPHARKRDERLEAHFLKNGFDTKSFNSQLLWEPGEVMGQVQKPYQVFGAFYRRAMALDAPSRPRSLSKRLKWSRSKIDTPPAMASLELLPRIAWAEEFSSFFDPGEKGADKSLKNFLRASASSYQSDRDFPSKDGTSKLSAHLHFGEIGIRRVWHEILKKEESASSKVVRDNLAFYRRELVWREFAAQLLFHFPHTATEPLREAFRDFPWVEDSKLLKLWQKGQTGYPIVDAGMRELWRTGMMHNRVRMIVASFLVKDLRISWVEGARWFWDTLVDADLANNSMGWQWAGGCGADAAPYFRIFNPTLQGEKFDPDGVYVRRWVPELAQLDKRWIHKPWMAPPEALLKAKVELGTSYPSRIVDHALARDAALKAFKDWKDRPVRSPR
jgi:deoxyribodipyrimidine photo-lyase